MSDWKQIRAKRESVCEICKSVFKVGEDIFWSRSRSVIRCTKCFEGAQDQDVVSIGKAGSSAQSEFEKRNNARRERVLKNYPKTGKFALKIIKAANSTTSWEKGAKAEREVGELINSFALKHGFKAMHDRAVPGSKTNIDHIIVRKTGIFVVDTKNYEGKIRVKKEISRGGKEVENLYINEYKKNDLVKKVKVQTELVQSVLHEAGLFYPVYGTLAFFHGEFPLIRRPMQVDGIFINGRGLEKLVTENIPGIEININKAFEILSKTFKDR